MRKYGNNIGVKNNFTNEKKVEKININDPEGYTG